MAFGKELNDLILASAAEFGVNPQELAAIINSESSGRSLGWHGKPNHSGYGYGGVTPGAAKQVGVDNFMDPKGNVQATAKYLKWLQTDQHLNDPLARAAAYKAGPGAWARNPNLSAQAESVRTGVKNVAEFLHKPVQQDMVSGPASPPITQSTFSPDGNIDPMANEKPQAQIPVANEAYKKMIDENLGFLPDWAKNYVKERGPDGGNGSGMVGSFSRAGLAGLENSAPLPFDARADHGQQLMSLVGLLIGDKLGGARSRQRIK